MVSKKVTKWVLLILEIIILVGIGFYFGESMTVHKCNDFIIKNYIENPAYRSLYVTAPASGDFINYSGIS